MVKNASEWTENESSISEIRGLPSTDSVIYVDEYTVPESLLRSSVIDLTNDDSSSQTDKTIKTLYFPARVFDRDFMCRTGLKTTSLVTLPIRKNSQRLRKFYSTSHLERKRFNNLSLLSIPEEMFVDGELVNLQNLLSGTSELSDDDYNVIEQMLQQEDGSLGGSAHILDRRLSVEDMMKIYRVKYGDTFD